MSRSDLVIRMRQLVGDKILVSTIMRLHQKVYIFLFLWLRLIMFIVEAVMHTQSRFEGVTAYQLMVTLHT